MPEIGTYSLSRGRRLARQRASSDLTANSATRLRLPQFHRTLLRAVTTLNGPPRNGPRAEPQPRDSAVVWAGAGCPRTSASSLAEGEKYLLTSPSIGPTLQPRSMITSSNSPPQERDVQSLPPVRHLHHGNFRAAHVRTEALQLPVIQSSAPHPAQLNHQLAGHRSYGSRAIF